MRRRSGQGAGWRSGPGRVGSGRTPARREDVTPVTAKSLPPRSDWTYAQEALGGRPAEAPDCGKPVDPREEVMNRVDRKPRFSRSLGLGVAGAAAFLLLAGDPAWAPPHGPPSPPKPPTGVSVAAGNTVATVSWNPAAFSVYGYFPTGYIATALGRRSSVQTCIASNAVFTCPLTGLTNGQHYEVDVRTTYWGRNFVPKVSRPSLRVAVTPKS
jgi:hypothetical protein